MTRIAFVGAGSVVFTKNLLGDILAMPALREVEIALHDIDADRLDTAEAMAHYVAGERGASPRISAHLDRRSALDGSDFVLNMVQIGGHEATLRDFDLPARYGLRQTIGDTLGIGGIFRTLRTAEHMLALGREMSELCPPAPGFSTTRTPWRRSASCLSGHADDQVVGLCHSVQFTVEELCRLVDMPENEVTFLPAGVNHQAFCSASRATGRICIRGSTSGSRPDPEFQRPSGSRSIAASATSRPSPASTPPSTCPGSCTTTTRSSATASRRRVHPPQRGEPRGVRALRRRWRWRADDVERSSEYAAAIVNRRHRRAGVIYGNVRNDGLIRPARRDVRRGAVPGRRQRRPTAPVPTAAAARGAEPDLPQRRRADGAGSARGVPRPHPARGDARSEHSRDAHPRRDRRGSATSSATHTAS